MKKLIFATVLALGSLTAVSAATATLHDGIMDVVMEQDFKEINVSDLPAAVTEALERDYAGATIDKAYVNDAGQYKLEVSLEDGTTGTLYADAEGNWIEM